MKHEETAEALVQEVMKECNVDRKKAKKLLRKSIGLWQIQYHEAQIQKIKTRLKELQ